MNRGAATRCRPTSGDPDPAAQGRRRGGRDRPAGGPGDPLGGRQCDVRASRRFPADRRTSSSITRHAKPQRKRVDSRGGRGQAMSVTGGYVTGKARAGELALLLRELGGAEGATAPGISQATGPRAPDSLEKRPPSLKAMEDRRRGKPPASRVKALSGSQRQTGATGRSPQGWRLSLNVWRSA